MIDVLEVRRLMSVSLDVPSKTLTVEGTDTDDDIVIKVESGLLKVDDNGALFSVNASAVTNIKVYAKDGHDNVTLEPSVTAASYLDSGPNTIVDSGDTIQGGSGPDVIHLRSSNGSASGGAGNDLIYNYGGLNRLYGEAGNDKLISKWLSTSESLYDGGSGYDLADYSFATSNLLLQNGPSGLYFPGNPPVVDGSNADTIANTESFYGGSGNDYIYGNAVSNYLKGNGGNDYLRGSGGNDVIDGGAGSDILLGDSGNDTLYSRDGTQDLVFGGAGTDSGQSDALDILNSVEVALA